MIFEGEIEKARAILDDLVQLQRRATSPATANELYALGIIAGNDRIPPVDGRAEIDNIRADASLAISRIGITLEFEPKSNEIGRYWIDAIDKVQLWIKALR